MGKREDRDERAPADSLTRLESLKAVVPALVLHLDYDGLAIGDGALAYEELRDPATPAERVAEIRAGLLAYCGRDTEALLELFRKFR